jgi:transcriptional regulator with XRE-family HTH domain
LYSSGESVEDTNFNKQIKRSRAQDIVKKTSTWAGYLRALRHAQRLTQAELADRFGVAPPTISRWESGRQKPSFDAQRRLQSSIDERQIMTEAAWCERIHFANSYELLFAPQRGVIAASKAARHSQLMPSSEMKGRLTRDFLPGGPEALARELKSFGYSNFEDIGVFFSPIRQVHIVIDICIDRAVYSRSLDIWPILSADFCPLAHAIGVDLPTPSDHASVKDIRIRTCNVVRLKPNVARKLV